MKILKIISSRSEHRISQLTKLSKTENRRTWYLSLLIAIPIKYEYMRMASNNSKLNTEMKMAGTSFFIATLVFVVLKFLTSETKRMQTKRHKKEKRKKCAEIRAEQMQAMKNIEMNERSRISPFFERRSKSDSNLLQFCRHSQSFTLAGPQHSAYTPRSAPTNENIFNFDPRRISRSMSSSALTPPAEEFTIPRSSSFSGRTKTVSEKKFGFSDNYKEWSLRRRDVEISAMNFDL